MTQYVVFLLLGLGSGTVFAAIGSSLVLTFRTSGVLNFATGAIAMYTTYVYANLRLRGDYLNPIVGLPPFVHVSDPMGFAPALVIALATAALLGLVLYLLVFRPMQNALPLSKVVASVGVMLALQSLIGLRAGTNLLSVPEIFPKESIKIGAIVVPRDRLFMAATVIVLGVLIWAIWRFTRFGLVSRAAADSEKGAVIVGVSPTMVSGVNWMLASMVAGFSGILIAPLVPLAPATYTLFVIPALAAALVGRLSVIGTTIAAGLAIGMVQSLVGLLAGKSWYPSFLGVQAGDAVPLLVIAIVLFVKGTKLPVRGSLNPPRLPKAYRPVHVARSAIAGGGLAVVGLFVLDGSYRVALTTSLVLMFIALSMVVITGYVGQISFVQLSLAGVGAFLLTRLATNVGVPFPLSSLLAALGAVAVGILVGLPALRVRGLELAVVTLAAGIALNAVFFQNASLTGGLAGATVESPSLFGIDLGIAGPDYPRVQFGLLVLAVLLACCVGVAHLRRSRLGNQMLAVRANERAAAATGISVTRTKVLAFAIASFLAGLGGTMIAYQNTLVLPESFDLFRGISLFAVVYLAGMTTISGAVVAGLIGPLGLVSVALDRAVDFGRWYEVVVGVALVVMAMSHPGGITGDIYHLREKRRERRLARAHEQPGPVAGASDIVSGEVLATTRVPP